MPTERVVAVSTKTYTVRAKRWARGWELHIDGEGVTQTRVLPGADAVARDYLASLHDADFSAAAITVVPDLGGIEADVRRVRAESAEAAAVQARAGANARAVVRALRRDLGLSVTDTATVLGVSRGRVSQLTD